MTQAVEKKLPVKNLERVHEQKFQSYEDAVQARKNLGPGLTFGGQTIVKQKVFARYDGTYDLVLYKNIGAPPAKEAMQKAFDATPEVMGEAAVKAAKAVHGLKSKDRKKSPKKAK